MTDRAPDQPPLPRVERRDLRVTVLARFLSILRPWVLIWIFLGLCLLIYAIAWSLRGRA